MRVLGRRALGAYAALRAQLTTGEWPPGSRLPSQSRLAATLGVAPLTLRQALERLEAEGMITRHSRRGTFVRRISAVPVRGLDEMFEVLFAHAPIGVSALDTAGCLVLSNPALQRLLGYSSSELEGKVFPGYTHPDDVPLQVEVIATAIAAHRSWYQLEKRYIRKDGSIVRCRVTVFSLLVGEQEVGALSFVEPVPFADPP